MTAKTFILAIDDDMAVLELLRDILDEQGYSVKTASSAFQARGALAKQLPDLIILDRSLPDAEGVALMREIRAQSGYENVPVLMLTGKGATQDKVEGLSSGADDYLTKPFAASELIARVAVLLRRNRLPPALPQVLEAAGLKIDLVRHEVEVQKRRVDLRPKEFELLVAFMERPGHVLSRQFLIERVWGIGKNLEISTKSVDVTISRLRVALGSWAKRITSVETYGYRLDV